MPVVKLRKMGRSKALTVPKEFKTVADNYHVYESVDGMILYVPDNIFNPFDQLETKDIYKNFKRKKK